MRSQSDPGNGRTALLSFSRHKLVKGPSAPARGGDIICLPGDIEPDMACTACSARDDALHRGAAFPDSPRPCYQAEVV
jgi:hypothetical protein